MTKTIPSNLCQADEDLFTVKKTSRDEIFDQLVAASMEQLFIICTRKVDGDYPNLPTIVTERQIEHSLRNLPVSVRSSMITKCFRHFGARKEP